MGVYKKTILFLVLLMMLGANHVLAKEVIHLDGGILVKGRTLVPMRLIFESLGANVEWNNTDQSIIATKDTHKIYMKVNDPTFYKNNEILTLDVPPQIKDGKTYVPLRFVGEALDADVNWDGEHNQAKVSTHDKDIIVNVALEQIRIMISAAGDFTLGRDEAYGYHGSFDQVAKNNGHAYFVKNIKDIFSQDNLTIVNLEGPLTNATAKAKKKFTFKGDPAYTEILKLGSIEAVSLANNHTYDFLQKGYDDTMKHLKNADIGFFGNGNIFFTEIEGVKVASLGFTGWNDTVTIRNQINNSIQQAKEKGAIIVIVSFHWGQERSYTPNQTQKSLGRFTIDSGADLVLGHHPHVVQGIEEYKDKFIVYSLGNFMFGGNRNPSDKDTFIFQQTFHVTGEELQNKKEINVLPFSVSSVTTRNDFQPTPLKGNAAIKLKEKLIQLSKNGLNTDWTQYEMK